MAEEPKAEFSAEELEAQEAEELPERETMMVVDPGPGIGIEPLHWPESEAPDDRYEQ